MWKDEFKTDIFDERAKCGYNGFPLSVIMFVENKACAKQ